MTNKSKRLLLTSYLKDGFFPEAFSALMFGVAIELFAVPSSLVIGGATGIATIINALINTPIGTTAAVLNIPILLIAYRYLGKDFLMKTIRVILMVTISTDIIMPRFPIFQGDPLIAAIFAGALLGGGLGIILNRGGSSGGTDILVRMIHMRYPHLGLGKLVLLFDLTVVLTGAIVYGKIETALYSIVMIYIVGEVIDKVIKGADERWVVLVMSEKREEISKRILTEISRGTTLMEGKGGYSNAPVKMLLCVTDNRQIFELKKLIKDIDSDAFVIVSQTAEILGQGFKSIL